MERHRGLPVDGGRNTTPRFQRSRCCVNTVTRAVAKGDRSGMTPRGLPGRRLAEAGPRLQEPGPRGAKAVGGLLMGNGAPTPVISRGLRDRLRVLFWNFSQGSDPATDLFILIVMTAATIGVPSSFGFLCVYGVIAVVLCIPIGRSIWRRTLNEINSTPTESLGESLGSGLD